MEEEKGGGGPPGQDLTREQVEAQRKAKKLLKEARKNKSLAGGGGGGGGEGGTPQAPAVQKEKAPKQSKPQGSEKQQQKPASATNPGDKEQKPKQQQQKQQKDSAKPKASNQSDQKEPQKQSQLKQAGESSEMPGKETVVKDTLVTPVATAEPATKVISVDPSKDSTPDRTSLGKTPVEFQSTIQSLFKVKRAPDSIKDKKFQLHPLFHSLGVKLRNDVVRGTNQRTVALLNAIKDFVTSYETPSGIIFKHGVSAELKLNIDMLRRKCPFAIGMNNAVEFLSVSLSKMDQEIGDVSQQKAEIIDTIDQYIEEKIEKAVEAIVYYGNEKDIIRTGDVVIIFSITEAVLSLLDKMAERCTYEIILVHTPETVKDIPLLLNKLKDPISNQKVTISSVNFSNAIYRMRHSTKVLIGGHGLFTTGGVMAQCGSGKLALLAATYNKPAIFLCETYKFCDRSPLDLFTLDEYSPEQSTTEEDVFEPKVKYDVTPAAFVTVVITDIDMLPSVSVPVVLRVQEGRAPRKTEEIIESP